MKLLLRDDAYAAETTTGMYVLTHEGPVSFTGTTAYRLLQRLRPYLTGDHSIDELTAELPEAQRMPVRKLLDALLSRGVLREVAGAPGPVSSPGERFLGYFTDSPADAERRYRALRTMVLGTGRLAEALARAAARSGLDHLSTVESIDALPSRDALHGVDLVLHCAGSDGAEAAALLARRCAERGIDVAHALVLGGDAWLCRRGWPSVWPRMRANGAPPVRRDVEPSEATATVVATKLVHEVFAGMVRRDAAATPAVVSVELSTLRSTRHTVLAQHTVFPVHAASATEAGRSLAALRGGARLGAEEFSRRASACRDERTGVFGEPGERDFAQVPLSVCAVTVADPAAGVPDTITACGLDFATARYRAAMAALRWHAARVVDPRRLAAGRVYGERLTDAAVTAVPAEAVFTPLGASAHGLGAGYDWAEAVDAGLLGQLTMLALAELDAAEPGAAEPYPAIDLGTVELDERGRRYRNLLAATGCPVEVYDLRGGLGAPVLLCLLDGRSAGVASGFGYGAALTGVLEQALLAHQAAENGQPGYAPAALPALPAGLRGAPAAPGPAADTASLARALAGLGHVPVAVPLDHDPAVSAVLPYLVHVVLTERGADRTGERG